MEINSSQGGQVTLSVVIPCYNEEKTLERCISRLISIADESLSLEIFIVDDASTDKSLSVAQNMSEKYSCIEIITHNINQGKGSSLRTGFKRATGDFVAVQDADLEYDPNDLKRLLIPLRSNEADVVLGSRFHSYGAHRVLYFWHYMGNKFLTFISNMLTDLNLTDMETCYKVFRREVIQNITIKENRFGFEPEIVANVAHMRVRIYEMGISYFGRTYNEGKKIGVRDGFRALYCILRYNAYRSPLALQFLIYLFIGGFSAIFHLISFVVFFSANIPTIISAPTSFFLAAVINYLLCILILFRHKARWNFAGELFAYVFIVVLIAPLDLVITNSFLSNGFSLFISKSIAILFCIIPDFLGRRFLVFPEYSSGPWHT